MLFLPPANEVWGKVIFHNRLSFPMSTVGGGGGCLQGESASRGSTSRGAFKGSASEGVCLWGGLPLGGSPSGGGSASGGLPRGDLPAGDFFNERSSYWNAFLFVM